MGSDWYWEKEGIQVPTLVDAVWEDGRTAATVNWPVTAGDTRGYNVPEIWPVKALKEDQREVYRKAASPAAFEEYYDRFISRYDWHSNHDLRVYGVEIAIDILRNHKPDLLLHRHRPTWTTPATSTGTTARRLKTVSNSLTSPWAGS